MYPKTLENLRERLESRFPGLTPFDNGNQAPAVGTDPKILASYLLWMCQRLEADTDRGRKSRWLGWVIAVAERELQLMSDNEAREWVRSDK